MNKKILFSFSLLLMISFCTGIFVEIIAPDHIMLSSEPPGFLSSLWGNLKSDLFLILLAVFFTLTIYLTPCIALLVLSKTFALGFSSAYLLSMESSGPWLLLLVIFTRTLLKLPAYIALLVHSCQTARQLKSGRPHTRKTVKNYLLCLMVLCLSSLIEVFLLQVMF